MQDHAVVLEAEAAGDLGEPGVRAGCGAGFDLCGDLLIEQVGVLDVAFVQAEVDLERVVRDPLKTGEIELLRRV